MTSLKPLFYDYYTPKFTISKKFLKKYNAVLNKYITLREEEKNKTKIVLRKGRHEIS